MKKNAAILTLIGVLSGGWAVACVAQQTGTSQTTGTTALPPPPPPYAPPLKGAPPVEDTPAQRQALAELRPRRS